MFYRPFSSSFLGTMHLSLSSLSYYKIWRMIYTKRVDNTLPCGIDRSFRTHLCYTSAKKVFLFCSYYLFQAFGWSAFLHVKRKKDELLFVESLKNHFPPIGVMCVREWGGVELRKAEFWQFPDVPLLK